MNSKLPTRLFSYLKGLLKTSFSAFRSFFARAKQSVGLMTKLEKYIALGLFILAIVLSGTKAYKVYVSKTEIAPATGGTYKEAVIGQLNFLNPIMASSDIDKSVSGLLFSSLVKFDDNKKMIMDAAEDVEISPDGLQYTFTIRDNIYFSDGAKLTVADIIYTLNSIKDPAMQSPLYGQWKDVEVAQGDNDKIIFKLPKAYGPFIYNFDFGILPSYLSSDQFAKNIAGSGPYKFSSAKKSGLIFENLKLKRNKNYYGQKYKIDNIELGFFSDTDRAKQAYENDKYFALSGAIVKKEGTENLSYSTEKKLILVPNLRKDKLKDLAFRKTIFSGEKFSDQQKLTLSTLDANTQKAQAEKIKKQFKKQNINLTIKYYDASDFQNILDQKDYELLLFGYDFAQDADPYLYWDSSQINYKNYAGFSDKNTDLILEEARMTQDASVRNQKYEQVYQVLNDQAVAKFFPNITTDFVIDSGQIKGLTSIIGADPVMKYYNFSNWYIKEKRVRKQ